MDKHKETLQLTFNDLSFLVTYSLAQTNSNYPGGCREKKRTPLKQNIYFESSGSTQQVLETVKSRID